METIQKKKILYVVTKSNWGGAQKYVYDLATSLPKDRFEVCVALGGSGEKNAEGGLLKNRLEDAGIKIVFIKNFLRDISLIHEIKAFFELVTIIKKEKPDVIHLNSSKAGGVGALAARLTGVKKIIFTVHGWPFNESRSFIVRVILWKLSWLSALLSTHVIVIGEQERKDAIRMPFISGKVVLVKNGIKTLEFLSREKARQELTIPQDALTIGSIGELTPNKNYLQLIKATEDLQKEKLVLAIIGDGEQKTHIVDRAEKILGNSLYYGYKMLGFKENAYKYLKAFDIFVLPSLKEGLPYTLLEAGLAGLPLIATDVGAISDIIPNENFGIAVKPRDNEALKNALETLLSDEEKRRNLGTAIQKHVQEEFSFETMVGKTVSLYLS
ncbi:MAG: glycosyltransferase family 4 protein [Patescibacteria group bacterium]|nr:glycosyltransferase family 4 protein [bacterium]MDZ4240929.1 glycosyltransferase family 4 protein [Patescibacteria group bacterium]